MKALSRPLLGPELKKSNIVESDKNRIQCTDLLALSFTTSGVLPIIGADQSNHLLRSLACWLAVLHIAALRSIALAFSSVYFLLASSFVADLGVCIAIILSYGAWALIFSLSATTASALQSLLRA